MASQSKFQIFADRHCDTTAWIDVTDTYSDNEMHIRIECAEHTSYVPTLYVYDSAKDEDGYYINEEPIHTYRFPKSFGKEEEW